MDRKLQDREFFRRDVLCVAPDLVGRILVRRLPDGTLLRARITETEAYRGADAHGLAGLCVRDRAKLRPVLVPAGV